MSPKFGQAFSKFEAVIEDREAPLTWSFPEVSAWDSGYQQPLPARQLQAFVLNAHVIDAAVPPIARQTKKLRKLFP